MPVGHKRKGHAAVIRRHRFSPVAGYMIAKRGVKIDAVYFHAPPYTQRACKAEGQWIWQSWLPRYTGPIDLHVVNFTDIQLYIYEKCPHEELTIIMRRYMMRIAESILRKRTESSGTDYGREYRAGSLLRPCSHWQLPMRSALCRYTVR